MVASVAPAVFSWDPPKDTFIFAKPASSKEKKSASRTKNSTGRPMGKFRGSVEFVPLAEWQAMFGYTDRHFRDMLRRHEVLTPFCNFAGQIGYYLDPRWLSKRKPGCP